MIHLSIRPRTSVAKSLVAGLLALSLSATASVVVAAPSAMDALGSAQTPAAVAAPSLVAALRDASLSTLGPAASIFDSASLGPDLDRTASDGVNLSSIIRPQVTAPTKVVAAAAKPKPKVTTSKPKVTVSQPKVTVATKKVTVSYHGTYHLWIPALSLSREIYDWGCNGGLIPNRVEYWGCVPKSNLYLLGHAWGVFAKIHDGYHSGALHAGLTAWYANKAGTVRKYRIAWVRHVKNADYASWSQWAMAPSSSQVITLQTCDGPTSAYRILVRLVPA